MRGSCDHTENVKRPLKDTPNPLSTLKESGLERSIVIDDSMREEDPRNREKEALVALKKSIK